jgi:hypothetical protein
MNENNEEFDPGAYSRLAGFLRSLADDIDSNLLTEEQLQRIGEFFMAYQFQEQAFKDNEDASGEKEEVENKEITREDLIKFLSVGWYVYCIIVSERTLPSSHFPSRCKK